MIETPKEAAKRLAGPMLDKGFVAAALHTYTDTQGNALYWRIRVKHPESGDKWIRPMKLNGQGYELAEPKFMNGKPLYALHRIASNPDAIVWITEGEQKADALNKLGLVATTSGGATSAKAADWQPLHGRTVRIWPDNDDQGKAYAGEVATILLGIGCIVSCIDVDKLGLAIGEDAIEWLAAHPMAAGGDIEALPILMTSPDKNNATARIVALTIDELLVRDFPPKEPLLTPWLRRQDLVMVHAWRGVGKTFFALNLAYATAGGGSFLNWKADKPHRVLYIDGEMPGAAIKERLAALVASTPETAEPPEGYFRIVTPDAQECPLPDLSTPIGQAAIAEIIGDAELIVIDNLSTLSRSGIENEGESWLPLAAWALRMRREGRAVVFIHHTGKSGAQRGTSRREDILDVVLKLQHPSDYNAEEGARFEVRFEKTRGLVGDAVKNIEAKLTASDNGNGVWTWRELADANTERIVELKNDGMSAPEIAVELGIHRSTVYRAIKTAKAEGKIKEGGGGG